MLMHSFFIALLTTLALGQTPKPGPPTIAEILIPSFNPFNEAALTLFPRPILAVETPISVRYFLITSLPPYAVAAACHPTALGFLGKRDPIPPTFCAPDPRARIFSYMTLRVLRSQFPLEAIPYAAFLQRNGLEVGSTATDVTTEVGWANTVTTELLAFLENDGWNSLGDMSRTDFRRPYEDPTAYKPRNRAKTSALNLRMPLRWQPLVQEIDNRGRLGVLEHVVPHVGRTVRPLVLSDEDFESRITKSPYESPNRKQNISKADTETMKMQIDKLLERNRVVTKEQIALAHWWDNKFFSLGLFTPTLSEILELDFAENAFIALGEAIAQHDAVLLAWKEKRRHDLVRPPTMIRRFFHGQTIRAFRGFGKEVGEVKAEEWEPVVKIQPHSEFPSASAVICTAVMEQLEEALNEIFQGQENFTIPAVEGVLPPFVSFSSPVDTPTPYRFETLQDAARSCGQSRLWSGVHFEPSVPAGEKLAEGLGAMARKHVSDLVAGRVPEGCWRCVRGTR